MLIDCSHTVQAAVFHAVCRACKESWKEKMYLGILKLLL